MTPDTRRALCIAAAVLATVAAAVAAGRRDAVLALGLAALALLAAASA